MDKLEKTCAQFVDGLRTLIINSATLPNDLRDALKSFLRADCPPAEAYLWYESTSRKVPKHRATENLDLSTVTLCVRFGSDPLIRAAIDGTQGPAPDGVTQDFGTADVTNGVNAFPGDAPQAASSADAQNLAALLRSLKQASVARKFVALKWFRDQWLPQTGATADWSIELRKAAIVSAIQGGYVRTYKVDNVRTPDFPVTAIAVNDANPEVERVLSGNASSTPNLPFQPVEIRGKPLSRTVLEDRR